VSTNIRLRKVRIQAQEDDMWTGFARNQTLLALKTLLVTVVVRIILWEVLCLALRMLVVGGLVAGFFVRMACIIALINTNKRKRTVWQEDHARRC